jgi:hypothetical protein
MLPTVKKLGGTILQQQQQSSSYGISTARPPTDASKNLVLWNHVDIPSSTDVSEISTEDILEVVTGGYIKSCGSLNAICQEANFYQFLTKEYIQHLGDYLLERCSPGAIIVDIGAGDGLLVQCLQDYMKYKDSRSNAFGSHNNKKRQQQQKTNKISSSRRQQLPTIVATDNMEWGIFTKAHVERLSVEQALRKYAHSTSVVDRQEQQVIILCSWMPMGQDWSQLFRDASVDEYILIGEADDGSCGHNWLTWGNPAFRGDDDDDAAAPPYEIDGYRRWNMDALTQFQFSSFDCSVSKSSKTVSFRKTT